MMTTKEINAKLNENFNAIQSWVLNEGAEKWEYGPLNKWTVGQHVLHLIQSTEALNKGLSIPKIVLNYRFGKCNRDGRNFETVVKKYNEKLAKIPVGTVATVSQNMPTVTLAQREEHLNKLMRLNLKLSAKASKIKKKALDESLLPHPLMGKMTLREILMWNAYHTKHHLHVLEAKY
jgi:hypothetical protein